MALIFLASPYKRLYLNRTLFDRIKKPLILIHSGVLVSDYISVDLPVSILGCSSGSKITSKVEIQSFNETTFVFGNGSKSSYLGYLTVKFNSDEFVGANSSDPGKNF